ncbi:MAG TPA: R3H domain-containing nucleic acid-binding protein, partial [Candidatus Acidoferrum sp.]|nr:R3H domain-containing nucleic acid-binding protein [Candidatus Acidoferrum sp.]
PPTFDVVVEIQDRDRVTVHPDVAETVDDLLRGDAVSPELRWRDEEGVHRSQSRPRPSPREQLGTERFAGLVGGGQSWRTEGGWRGDAAYRTGYGSGYREADRGSLRSGYRPGASGGWRQTRGGSGRDTGSRPASERGRSTTDPTAGPGPSSETFEGSGAAGDRFAPPGLALRGAGGLTVQPEERPFIAGDIADRGPLERPAPGTPSAAEQRARDARELDRQRAWREQASRALDALKADEGTGPVNADDVQAAADLGRAEAVELDEADEPDDGSRGVLHVEGAGSLPTLRALPQGISRKRLEQAIRELQLPVVIARDVDEADVVMTLKSEYRQKTPMLREAEERAMPIYVLKANTIQQMQASLTSIFALELDPREAAMRETEEAIDIVIRRAEPVELSPQNAYIRRLQHQMAERANLVSRSRGREPYRRVRLYPDAARAAWR